MVYERVKEYVEKINEKLGGETLVGLEAQDKGVEKLVNAVENIKKERKEKIKVQYFLEYLIKGEIETSSVKCLLSLQVGSF